MVAILLFFFRSLTGFVAVFLVRGFAKVRGSGQPVDLVDDDDVNPARPDVGD
jgi:hypothetical protein